MRREIELIRRSYIREFAAFMMAIFSMANLGMVFAQASCEGRDEPRISEIGSYVEANDVDAIKCLVERGLTYGHPGLSNRENVLRKAAYLGHDKILDILLSKTFLAGHRIQDAQEKQLFREAFKGFLKRHYFGPFTDLAGSKLTISQLTEKQKRNLTQYIETFKALVDHGFNPFFAIDVPKPDALPKELSLRFEQLKKNLNSAQFFFAHVGVLCDPISLIASDAGELWQIFKKSRKKYGWSIDEDKILRGLIYLQSLLFDKHCLLAARKALGISK